MSVEEAIMPDEIWLSAERERLEVHVMDYVRAGWTVTNRTGIRARLVKGDQTVELFLDQTGEVVIDGPPLPKLIIDGRVRAWAVLLAILVAVFLLAWLLGYFRF